MMASSDNTSEIFFDGEDVQEKATSLGWSTSSEDFLKFPLAEPKLKYRLNYCSR